MRPENRRLNKTISLRTTLEAKTRLQRAATQNGYSNLSAWAVDILENAATGSALRERRVIIGRLGQFGGHLSRLHEQLTEMDLQEVCDDLQNLIDHLHQLQIHIMDD